jgi:molybdopterin converting factor small subunit
MAMIRIPTPLRPYTNGLKEVHANGQTVGFVIRDLTRNYPDLKHHLFNKDGDLRPYVNLFLNQKDIRMLQGEETPIRDDDQLMIVPSIAGGIYKQVTL